MDELIFKLGGQPHFKFLKKVPPKFGKYSFRATISNGECVLTGASDTIMRLPTLVLHNVLKSVVSLGCDFAFLCPLVTCFFESRICSIIFREHWKPYSLDVCKKNSRARFNTTHVFPVFLGSHVSESIDFTLFICRPQSNRITGLRTDDWTGRCFNRAQKSVNCGLRTMLRADQVSTKLAAIPWFSQFDIFFSV